MPTIDAQVHAYERDHPGRPWANVLRGPPQVTGDEMVAAMDAVGVDGALLVSPFAMYRYDASYALAVHAAHPGRFGLIKPVDPTEPGSGRHDCRLGRHQGHGRHPDHAEGYRVDRPRRPRSQSGSGRRRATL